MNKYIGHKCPRTRCMKGLTLVESLVALVVLALGVLGLLGVQLKMMGDNQTANHRTTAARLAEELFERAKTNTANVVAPNAPMAAANWNWMNLYDITWGAALPADQNCTSDGQACNSVQRANQDLRDWLKSVRSTLPGGNAMVVGSPATRQFVVIIGWHAKNLSTGNSAQDAALRAPFDVSIPGVLSPPAACDTTHICHVAFGQP